jgi:hypothetical protein
MQKGKSKKAKGQANRRREFTLIERLKSFG